MDAEQDEIGQIEYQVAILIRRAMAFSTLYKQLGAIDRPGYLLLRQLNESGVVGLKELADEHHLDRSTISRQIAALELKGLVRRIPDPIDGRMSLFDITKAGLEQLNKTKQIRHDRYAALLKLWSDEDLVKFGELLALLNRTFID
ncbi:MarR family transcriptional regulator [Alicyclobacillus fastidiosus]|uniref:MarR family transcriptional regulator n=1 Tax=Alicyclobacillus fastidiosus TaxID=392011 RepID=A0ABY6ZLX9_9BACL|nr:MarR family transcriptional regulator [Alicyclobacillus fastidiosus]WAH43854.1 MarR family transcriptional regulator [Alicyclobacillus fastidiosus]GMA60091.1 putative HTH-type transcriptional regulator YxaD [Alicyclobacillus fastidiosus]